jgi:hypothetical protein
MGGSDLGGRLVLDPSQDPLTFDADLRSDALRLADLEGLIGGDPNAPKQSDPERVIPNEPISLPRLQAANGKARLVAGRIEATSLPIDNLTLEATLDHGVLHLRPARFGVAGGQVDLYITLDGTREPAGLELQGTVRQLRLKEAFRDSPFVQETGGLIDGQIRLNGQGRSPHEILGSADGALFLAMSDGSISGLLVELAGLDVIEALGLLPEDTPTGIRCMVADLDVQDGVAASRMLLLDTEDTRIEGTGTIDLGEEALDLAITPHPKDLTLLSLRARVLIDGTFKAPAPSLDAASILAFVPPIDLGLAEDAPCKQLIERARIEQSGPAKAVTE